MNELQFLIILLLSTVFSLISFIIVTAAANKEFKKMRDEMYGDIWRKYKKRSDKQPTS